MYLSLRGLLQMRTGLLRHSWQDMSAQALLLQGSWAGRWGKPEGAGGKLPQQW